VVRENKGLESPVSATKHTAAPRRTCVVMLLLLPPIVQCIYGPPRVRPAGVRDADSLSSSSSSSLLLSRMCTCSTLGVQRLLISVTSTCPRTSAKHLHAFTLSSSSVDFFFYCDRITTSKDERRHNSTPVPSRPFTVRGPERALRTYYVSRYVQRHAERP
jgi:hypothetical protein